METIENAIGELIVLFMSWSSSPLDNGTALFGLFMTWTSIDRVARTLEKRGKHEKEKI